MNEWGTRGHYTTPQIDRRVKSPVKMSWTPCHYLFGDHYKGGCNIWTPFLQIQINHFLELGAPSRPYRRRSKGLQGLYGPPDCWFLVVNGHIREILGTITSSFIFLHGLKSWDFPRLFEGLNHHGKADLLLPRCLRLGKLKTLLYMGLLGEAVARGGVRRRTGHGSRKNIMGQNGSELQPPLTQMDLSKLGIRGSSYFCIVPARYTKRMSIPRTGESTCVGTSSTGT